MNEKHVKEIIKDALNLFNKHEKPWLSKANLYEPCVSHRIAVMLEKDFKGSGYNIDCEYNKNILNPKTNKLDTNIRPDIIIHQRGNNDNNLAMIEIKKGSKNTVLAKRDIKKLMSISNLNYRVRLFVGILRNRLDLVWIGEDGVITNEEVKNY